MNEYSREKLDRYYARRVEDANRAWERAFEDMRR
jgi:hypothetical protein